MRGTTPSVPRHNQRGRAFTPSARLFGASSSAPKHIVPTVFLKFKPSDKALYPCHSEPFAVILSAAKDLALGAQDDSEGLGMTVLLSAHRQA